jgi:hypothetical protein
MKQLIALILLAVSVSAMAQPGFRHYHHGYYPGYNYGWVAPTIIGGVIGYEIARNQPPVIVQPPVVVQQYPVPPAAVYYGQSQQCTAWTEVQNSDGTITRTRTCSQ